MTFSFANLADALKSGAQISPEDVLAARRWAWSDGGISPPEAETIFELNQLIREPSVEWSDFFVEALNEYIVNGQEPRGYVDAAKADWLVMQVDQDGRVDTLTELELLVKVLETALNVPESLKDYALRQLEQVVLTGEGPTRRGGSVRPGVIDEAEVALLRRLIFAAGCDGALIVGREEVEMLWRLKDATVGAANAEGWQALFVQAVGNHLMAYSAYRPLDRGEAARLEAFVANNDSSFGRFVGRMLRSNPVEAARGLIDGGTPGVDHAGEAAKAEEVSSAESAWVPGHVDADGRLDSLEQALLAFIERERGLA
jgi:hypothetical protein